MNIRNIKPIYWIIIWLAIGWIVVKLLSGSESIDDQIKNQEKIVAELTAKVEYATGDIQKRIAEYNQLYKLNGWAKKTLEALKKAKELNSKTIDANLDEMFVFTWSIY